MEKYVIIGNGTAAAACIEGIRSIDQESPITVVSEEEHAVYCRPLISYYLQGKTDPVRMLYRGEDFYEKNDAIVLYGKSAVSIDPEKKVVTLDDGTLLSYTKLMNASGSRPIVPKFEGIETVKNCFTFMTLDDAEGLKATVTKDSRVLIIGAGLIGLKCAEGLKDRVGGITVCDLADRILSSILDASSAAVVQKHLEDNGVRFLLSDSAARFDGTTAYLQSGAAVDFDVLVVAIGVRANIQLIQTAGGSVNRGILVDDHMRTTIPDVYAAGDCTESRDISSGTDKVMALMPNAYFQGKCAGMNMAGEENVFDKAIPMNSIGFFGLHMMTAGTRFSEEDGGSVYEECNSEGLKKLFLHDNVLTGFMLVGKTERAGIYTSMIREKTPLDSVNFDLLKTSPVTAAYAKDARKLMFTTPH